MYQYILFDLDGTLTDSREGITKSVQYALDKMGIHEPELKPLERFIGPPLYDEFRRSYGFDDFINEKRWFGRHCVLPRAVRCGRLVWTMQ